MNENDTPRIKHLEAIIREQTETMNQQRIELAHHREFSEYSRKHPWQFFLWLLLNNVWPFSLWYHRFDGGAK